MLIASQKQMAKRRGLSHPALHSLERGDHNMVPVCRAGLRARVICSAERARTFHQGRDDDTEPRA